MAEHTEKSALVLRNGSGIRGLVDVEFIRGSDHNRQSIKLRRVQPPVIPSGAQRSRGTPRNYLEIVQRDSSTSLGMTGFTSQARNALLFFNRTTNCIPPIVVKIGNWPAKSFFVYPDTKFSRVDFSQLFKGNIGRTQDRYCFFQISWRDGNDD